MSVSKIVTAAVTVLSLVAVPALASAAPGPSAASRLLIEAPTGAVVGRLGAQTVAGKKAGEGKSGVIVGLLALIAVGVGIAVAAGGKKNSVSA